MKLEFLQSKKIFLSVFLVSILSTSCHKSPRMTNKCMANIEYSTCTATEGCVLTFTCPFGLSQTPSSLDKMTHSLSQFFKIATPVTMEISSLTINQPYLLQASAGEAPTNWYNSSVSCVQDGNTVTCENFKPIADDFTIVGSLGEVELELDVIVTNTLTKVESCGEMICGETGTTVERMFDCSERVTNYAGKGNGDGTATTFVPGNDPDPNWFLVSSPSASDNQKCFWLSPVMEAGNPALGTDQYDSLMNPMSDYSGGRLLWSGVASNTYNFFQANGKNPFDADPVNNAYYSYYQWTNDNIMATQPNVGSPTTNGPWIYAPDAGMGLEPIINLIYSSSWNDVTNMTSVCAQGIDPVLLPGNSYTWQIPSYPMMITLTGGYNSGCGSHLPEGNNANCNGGNGEGFVGFSATDPIPGFQRTGQPESYLWSSSIYSPDIGGWYFNGNQGTIINGNPDGLLTAVRCVSFAW